MYSGSCHYALRAQGRFQGDDHQKLYGNLLIPPKYLEDAENIRFFAQTCTSKLDFVGEIVLKKMQHTHTITMVHSSDGKENSTST